MEPLQEHATKVTTQAEDAKKNMAQTQVECAEMIDDKIVVQVLDALREKTVQAQMQAKKLTKKFQALAGEIEEAHKVQVTRDEPHVNVGGMLDAG